MPKLPPFITRLPYLHLSLLLLCLSLLTPSLTAHPSQFSLLLLSVSCLIALASLIKIKPQPTPLTLLYLLSIVFILISSAQHQNFIESLTIPETPFFYLFLLSLCLHLQKKAPSLTWLVSITLLALFPSFISTLLAWLTASLKISLPTIPVLVLSPIDWFYLAGTLSITIYLLIPNKRWLLPLILIISLTQLNSLKAADLGLPLDDTYTFLIEELKTPTSLILGTSPSRFAQFFGSHYSGLEASLKSVPSHSQSLLVTILSTIGVLGLLSILSIYIYIYQKITKNIDTDKNISLYIKILFPLSLLASALLPISTNSIILFHIIAIYLTIYLKETSIALPIPKPISPLTIRLPQPLILAPVIILSLFLAYWQTRSLIADSYLHLYRQSAQKSQSLKAYNEIRTAISWYPYRAQFHTEYSLVNLVLAGQLTSEGISTDQDRSNITGLYQQAIREATTATILEPQNYQYWKNLGVIYRELISLATNSHTYSESAYSTAIKLAPQNASLWLDLGVTYFKAGLYDRSCEVTAKALELQPEWYQAHANMGLCYHKLGQTQKAKTSLETALTLTSPGTPEYQQITQNLKELN